MEQRNNRPPGLEDLFNAFRIIIHQFRGTYANNKKDKTDMQDIKEQIKYGNIFQGEIDQYYKDLKSKPTEELKEIYERLKRNPRCMNGKYTEENAKVMAIKRIISNRNRED